MGFEIPKETISRVGEFSLEEKKWRRQAKVNEEASLHNFFKFKEESMREALPKPWHIICYAIYHPGGSMLGMILLPFPYNKSLQEFGQYFLLIFVIVFAGG